MSKHTPGPWEWREDYEGLCPVSGGFDILQWEDAGGLWLDGADDENIASNARLIAAAPELLEALKHAVRWHDQLSANDIKKMEAAIAKAEGRT